VPTPPWQIRITKLAATALPRILANTAATGDIATGPTRVTWKLRMRERDLDSNIIALDPDEVIETHAGPDVDVLIHVLAGSGQLETELDALSLRAGSLLWLPRRSRRRFAAGPDGLRYLTVHQRRQALTLTTSPPTT
jgi:quercetin dioxygenase-like cupin family protein